MTDSEAMSLQLSGLRYKVKELSAENEKLRAALQAVDAHLKTTFPPYAKGQGPFDLVREALK